MEYCRVLVEAHARCATLYVAGFLTDLAASRTEEIMGSIPSDTEVVRVDLRAVDLIDPESFVRVVRALNQWRDRRRGRVTIEFPYRSLRRERNRRQYRDELPDQHVARVMHP